MLRVEIEGVQRMIPYQEGHRLGQILESSGVAVRRGCNGNGTCGMCRVKVKGKSTVPLTANEVAGMSELMIGEGFRLACQFIPRGDTEVILPKRERKEVPRPLGNRDGIGGVRGPFDRAGTPGFGIAVDVGTTNIRVSLVDILHGRRLGGSCRPNPQSFFGLDVISRLEAASGEPEKADAIREETIGSILEDIAKLCSSNGVASDRIGRIRIVGNTAMLLLIGLDDPQTLLETDNWSRKYDSDEFDGIELRSALNFAPRSVVDATPPLAGFVGSDLTANIISTGLIEDPGPNLLIDFGTNNEICLWDGARLLITACAGGPALEGVGVSCGAPAIVGSAYRAVRAQDGTFDLAVLGGGSAHGVCGSGLIDIIADLVRVQELDEKGNFTNGQKKYVVTRDARLSLTKSDVDKIMRAKSAVASGINALLRNSGLRPDSIRNVHITGNLGRFLNVDSAKQIGLLPNLPSRLFNVQADSTLMGCEEMLVSAKALEVAERSRQLCEPVDLVREPGFEDLFLENLFLRPMSSGPTAKDIGLDEYIKTSQYLAGINTSAPELEISRAILRFMGADLVGLAVRTPKGLNVTHSVKDNSSVLPDLKSSGIEETCLEVFDSGFLNNLDLEGYGLRMIFLPVSIERRVTHVLMVGYANEVDIDRQRMNVYLALATLIGTVLQRVRNEEELRRHRTDLVKLVEEKTGELMRSNAELQHFAYIASHDLQEPLRMVVSYLSLLDMRYKEQLDPKAKEYIVQAIAGAVRMRQLIDDLLEYSRVETKGNELTPVNMETVVAMTLSNLKISLEESKATIAVDALPVIIADEMQMVQVMQNLIGNAIKFRGATR